MFWWFAAVLAVPILGCMLFVLGSYFVTRITKVPEPSDLQRENRPSKFRLDTEMSFFDDAGTYDYVLQPYWISSDQFEKVTIGERQKIDARIFRPAENKAKNDLWLVCMHGLGATQNDPGILFAVSQAIAAGCHAITFDHMDVGESYTFNGFHRGGQERRVDVELVLNYLSASYGVSDEQCILYGSSLGAETVLQTILRRTNAFAGAILEAPFLDFATMAVQETQRALGSNAFIARLIAHLAFAVGGLTGRDIQGSTKTFGPTKKFWVQIAGNDGRIPADESFAVASALCRDPDVESVKISVAAQAGHGAVLNESSAAELAREYLNFFVTYAASA